jgi:hypothetical protein
MIKRYLPQLQLDISWECVKTNNGSSYEYPQSQTSLNEQQYGIPVVYRWAISIPGSEPHACYIGETDNLYRRVRNYLYAHPSQTQASRVADRFRKEISKGSVVRLQMLTFGMFYVNNQNIDPPSLSDSARRKLMENLAIVLHDKVHCELLNEDMSRFGRRIKLARSEPST